MMQGFEPCWGIKYYKIINITKISSKLVSNPEGFSIDHKQKFRTLTENEKKK